MVLEESKCHKLAEHLSSASNKQVFLGTVDSVVIVAFQTQPLHPSLDPSLGFKNYLDLRPFKTVSDCISLKDVSNTILERAGV